MSSNNNEGDSRPRITRNRRYCINQFNKPQNLEEIFKRLNRECVKIKKSDRISNNLILYSVINELLEKMKKQNKLFRSMKPKLEYLGSYFDGLRVGQPTEYDLNVVLKLPINYDKIYLDATKTTYDCTFIFMSSEFRRLSKTPATMEEGFEDTIMWCDSNYRLSVKKFRSWMQKVVDTALKELWEDRKVLNERNKHQFQITAKISGPANTINIRTVNSDSNFIDVDLVPTLSFVLPKKPFGSRVLFEYVEKATPKTKEYFVVPKPSDDEFSWRLAFPFQERNYLNNKNNLKSSAKLLKLLRDGQDFKLLASYYIKTIFLWEAKNQDEAFWKHHSLSFLVLHMMKKLRDCLAKEEIKNFWCPEVNLIKGKIKSETCHNWSNRLSVIIKDIEQGTIDFQVVTNYFIRKLGC